MRKRVNLLSLKKYKSFKNFSYDKTLKVNEFINLVDQVHIQSQELRSRGSDINRDGRRNTCANTQTLIKWY